MKVVWSLGKSWFQGVVVSKCAVEITNASKNNTLAAPQRETLFSEETSIFILYRHLLVYTYKAYFEAEFWDI